jgi:hypothetical protein
MGSIVGALYAIGYSADDIEKIVKDVDWDTILSNQIPLNQITYEEKFYYGRYIAELPVDGIKVGLPRGLIEGQKLSERLSRITRAAHDIEDFNNLPIPFCLRCRRHSKWGAGGVKQRIFARSNSGKYGHTHSFYSCRDKRKITRRWGIGQKFPG